MSDENNTLNEGGGEALPAASETPAKLPKNDAEAAALEEKPEGEKPEGDAESKKSDESAERKRNRTREYIAKLNRENAELRAFKAEQEAKASSAATTKPDIGSNDRPTLEKFNFDNDAYLEALADWKVEQRLSEREKQQQKAESARSQHEVMARYNAAIAEFAEDHPDFQEVVGSIKYPLADALQAAIMAHPNGPEIAYHLGTNDDDAFAMASIQPALAAAAVERLASRLTAAHQAPQNHTNPKPVSKAPAPVPTVSGRSPTEVPPEKMTDDEWYARERAKRAAK